jgi:hypothetical protein
MTSDSMQPPPNPVELPTPTRRALSISQLQLWYRCGYAWHLRYALGHSPRVGAGAWFGRMMHEVIGQMYRSVRMELAHTEVWTRECGPVWDDLQRLIDLDAAYAAHGRPTTSAAKQWRAEHPAYDAILARIADHQRHALGSYRWGKTQSLADYYRRAVALLAHERDMLLPAPILVEGIPATALERLDEDDRRDTLSALPIDSDRAAGAETDEDGRGTRYQLLAGTIAGVEVVGVPDVLARGVDGRLCVADYKTGTPHDQGELAENAQLAIYVELLRQNGYIARDDVVTIGHIYLIEDGVRAVWANTLQHTRVMARLERQVSLAAALMEHQLISDRKGLDTFQSPCAFCDLAHVCDA